MTTIDQIVEETRSLPHDTVLELVDRILLNLHGGQSPQHAQAWTTTLQRRVEEVRSGAVQTIPHEETAAKIRRIVGR
ncbi:Putative addiction module component [Opitutaceae bacterium TAV1]|nr:addiction module antitoxin RelB [Opitutaceae bacterium TAV5]EIP97782.1 Putative addiction module component [Opitutaceae bacterium TAV1]